MSNHDQAMKHWKNHRKDRFFQQCSGYAGDGKSDVPKTNEELCTLERESFAKVLEAAKTFPFPAHVFQTGGVWRITDKPNLFSSEVKTYEELVEFGRNYVE